MHAEINVSRTVFFPIMLHVDCAFIIFASILLHFRKICGYCKIMTHFSRAFTRIANDYDCNQAEIAEACEVPQASISRYLSGKLLPSNDMVLKILPIFRDESEKVELLLACIYDNLGPAFSSEKIVIGTPKELGSKNLQAFKPFQNIDPELVKKLEYLLQKPDFQSLIESLSNAILSERQASIAEAATVYGALQNPCKPKKTLIHTGKTTNYE